VDRQNGRIDEAIAKYRQIVEGGFEQAAGRGFDFSEDWRVLNELGSTLYQRARMARGEANAAARAAYLREAADVFEASLALDPEGVPAHYGLMQVLRDLGDEDGAAQHEALHAKYKPDDNARDHAISEARKRYPAANRAAESVVVYELTAPPHRASPGAPPQAGERTSKTPLPHEAGEVPRSGGGGGNG
jgi:tetratricopeptide (TPR) repeat protein